MWSTGIVAEEESATMSVDIIRKAHEATEEGFLSIVAKQWPIKPQLAVVGSYCLTGLICDGKRAVLGRIVRATGEVLAMQLSAEHNASIESVRQELHSLHPDDSQIVILKHNVWRVKGLIQSLGGCNRCQMINLNYQEGEVKRLNEPLATLAAYRRVKGKIFFGILLRYDDGKEEASSLIQVGEEVYPVEDLL